jgi:hypothetical protein
MVTEAKKNRIRKAVRLYYGPEDLNEEEIAEEMDKRRPTISGYLNHDFAEEIKSPYSDKEKREVQKALEEKFEELENKTEDVVKGILSNGTYDQRIKAIRELRQNHKELADFLEKIGALDTEAEKHEVEHSGVPAVQIITGEEETSGEPQGTSGEEDE